MGYGTGAIMAVPSGDQRDSSCLQVRPRDPCHPAAARRLVRRARHRTDAQFGALAGRLHRRRVVRQLVERVTRPEPHRFGGRGRPAHERVARSQRARRGDDHLQAARLGVQPPALLGRAVPDRLRRRRPAVRLPDEMLPVELPDTDSFSPRTFDADDEFSNPRARSIVSIVGERRARPWRRTEAVPARHQRDAAVGGLVLVRAALHRPDERRGFVDPAVEALLDGPAHRRTPDHPGGVDLYVGGVEHAVLHLLYARFWHKVLYDLGHLSSKEPTRACSTRVTSSPTPTRTSARSTSTRSTSKSATGVLPRRPTVTARVGQDGQEPEERRLARRDYEAYGADTFRLYEMAMGPLDASRPWETRDVVGMYRFLQRLWRAMVDETTGEVVVDEAPADDETRRSCTARSTSCAAR